MNQRHVLAAIASYCSTTPPTLANANTPAANTGVFATTSFTCAHGYSTSDSLGGSSPYYQCLPGSATTGTWSNVVYSCIGARLL